MRIEAQSLFTLISTEAQALYAYNICDINAPQEIRQTISMDSTQKACSNYVGMKNDGTFGDKKVSVLECNIRKPDGILTGISTETHTYATAKSLTLLRIYTLLKGVHTIIRSYYNSVN